MIASGVQYAGDSTAWGRAFTRTIDEAWLLADHKNKAGKHYPDWTGYIAIDAMGGIRLFNTYDGAIRGNASPTFELAKPGATTQIWFEQKNNKYRCLAGIRNYEFTTERETIDSLASVTSQAIRITLISGQGPSTASSTSKASLLKRQTAASTKKDSPSTSPPSASASSLDRTDSAASSSTRLRARRLLRIQVDRH